MKEQNRCTLIVNTCDKYEEAWYPFFELLKKYWPDRQMEIVLNTETKIYKHEGLNIKCINYSGDGEWSDRLINVLEQIDSKYVILLLEDFFFQNYVKQAEIDNCLRRMEDNDNIGVFYFKHITGHDLQSDKFLEYNVMNKNNKYILNCQAALWNKSALLEVLVPGENPWIMEEEGHLRLNSSKEFYCSNSGTYNDSSSNVFNYLWAMSTGYGICKSKWLWNNKKLFRKNHIQVQYKNLSKMTRLQYWKLKITSNN